MADPKKIENAIRRVRNQKSFIQELLIDALGWNIDERAEDVEDITFEWSAEELRANDLDKHLVDGTIRQIRPFKGNPWGIFILEFKNPDVFATGRGMTGPLRNVLRGLVPSKKKRSSLASFRNENLLFICNHDYKHYRFAHFKTPDKNAQTAPLAAFGWGPGDPIRTLCEYNLAALEWPDGQPGPDGWVAAWSQAFDVEKVTKRFYGDYAAVFEKVEKLIGKQKQLKGDDLRMFTQTLFNRLMFLRFMERKGWLTFDDRKDYLRALYAAGGYGRKSFYKGRLCPLFFEGLAVEGKQKTEAYGAVPYLNGGLFERSELDKQVSDLPDDVFAGILADEQAGGLFYRYNFTVEESTPLDIEVAVDPEMLGKVFEELVTGRHESGSYYTPRPVVSFMCREALKGYLSGRTKASPEAIAALVDEQNAGKLKETHAREILTALDDLKAVDPACGSGAYLLGLLQEMIVLYRLLYSEKLVKDGRTLYDLKLRIISQSLYGVDIDPFATSIAKLRLWLSLAVEADKPVPLPNLDFKVETGDSLLAPDPQEMPDLFRGLLQASADVLAMVKNQFFLSHGEEKEGYRKTIISEEARLRTALTAEHGEGVVDWRIQFAEAFANKRGGFDAVLANPPYVRQELIRSVKPQLKEVYPAVYNGTADLYCYFYARSLQLLRPGGMLAFISSNKWFLAGYGEKLRRHVAGTCSIKSITDFGSLPVFQSADTYPMIFVAQKVLRKAQRSMPQNASKPFFTKVRSLASPYPDVLAIIQRDGYLLSLTAIRGSEWSLTDPVTALALEQMRGAGTPLADYIETKIFMGLKTGLNDAYYIDDDCRKALIAEDPRSKEVIKPLALGRDINRWKIDHEGRWFLLIPIGTDIKQYPAVLRHLKQWQDRLETRCDRGHHWWELRPCDYYQVFSKPKILYQEIATYQRFAFDTTGCIVNNKVFMIPRNDLFLLGVLNSRAAWLYLTNTCQKMLNGALAIQTPYLLTMPIPKATDKERMDVNRLVQKCLDAKGVKCGTWEKGIDDRVTSLYGLRGEMAKALELVPPAQAEEASPDDD
jgi:hypothetical protein